jgi:hypothetical protein
MPRSRLLSLAVLLLLIALPALPGAEPARFPPVDQLPARADMPDPLVFLDGKKVTSKEDWARRRVELKELFQHYMYGKLPAPVKVTAKVDHVDPKAFGGKATLKEITLRLDNPEGPALHLLLVVPNERKGPAPVFVGLNFCGNHALVQDPGVRVPTVWMYPNSKGVEKNRATEAGRGTQVDVWALEQTVARGYAVATFYAGEIDPDQPTVREGVQRLWRKPGDKETPQDGATIMVWAWGVHRVVDYLVTDGSVDAKRIAVVGHSRLGKASLVAAAFDERLALAIPHQAGCGGTAPNRGKIGESVQRINTSFPHWFCGEFKTFNDAPERLPFDQNGLVALVAPRPVLFSNAVEDTWANPEGQFEVLRAADPVYRFLGAGGLEARKMPDVGTLSDGTLGYYIRPGKHSMTAGDWKVFCDFADKHLK